jgi:hypothetical protein
MTYPEILKQLEEYRYALDTEHRLARAGEKSRPDFVAIQKRHEALFSKEMIAQTREFIGQAENGRERERMERALFALLEGHLADKTLPIEEDIIAEQAKLAAEVDGVRTGFHEFSGKICKENRPERRERLRAAHVGLVEKLHPHLIERERVTRQGLKVFGFSDSREYAETKKRVRYEELLKKSITVLEETTGIYRRVLSDVIRKSYDRGLGELGAAQALHWKIGREFEHLFPAERLMERCGQALSTMGLDLAGVSSIKIDAEDRPKKNPRAFCYGAKVPGEIHLITRPRGGFDDYRSFMHEAGHALHFAHTDPALPYEWRQLPRSRSLTGVFAMLLEHLTQSPLWLEHALKLPKAAADRVGSWAVLVDLYLLRRQIAKFSYELAFDENPFDQASNKTLYAKTLDELTGFRHEPAMYLYEQDPLFQSADRIRSWIASAQLEEHLTRTFGDRWFLKRETGEFLKKLFAKGVSWENEDLVQSLGMTVWDPLPLVRKFDSVARLLR